MWPGCDLDVTSMLCPEWWFNLYLHPYSQSARQCSDYCARSVLGGTCTVHRKCRMQKFCVNRPRRKNFVLQIAWIKMDACPNICKQECLQFPRMLWWPGISLHRQPPRSSQKQFQLPWGSSSKSCIWQKCPPHKFIVLLKKSSLYGQYLTSDGAVIVSLRPAPPSPEINVGITILIFLCLERPPLNSLATLILRGRRRELTRPSEVKYWP